MAYIRRELVVSGLSWLCSLYCCLLFFELFYSVNWVHDLYLYHIMGFWNDALIITVFSGKAQTSQ